MSKILKQEAGDRPVAMESPALFGWPGSAASGDPAAALQAWGPWTEYMTDAMQRTILFWDVLRQRSDQYYAQKAKAVPHVLSFDAELVLDGRRLRVHVPGWTTPGHPRPVSTISAISFMELLGWH